MTKYKKLKDQIGRFGLARGLLYALDRTVNRILLLDCHHVIILERERVNPLKDYDDPMLSFRFADESDMVALRAMPEWDIDEAKWRNFREGDKCLLVYYDSELAGYTWVHLDGRPLIIPGLRLSMPIAYAYNYAGFTLPKFRGKSLQAIRHCNLIHRRELSDRKGLIGYVRYDNWSSQRGQQKSGYHSIGRIWLFGTKKNFLVFISRNLKRTGIRRIRV